MNVGKLNKLFKGEDSRFFLKTGLKFFLVSIVASLLIAYFVWLILEMNVIIFETNNLMVESQFKEAYFDFILKFLIDSASFVLFFYFLMFFCGMYSASMLIRPFRSISKFCEDFRENQNLVFDKNTVLDFKVFREVSDHFFQNISRSIHAKDIKFEQLPAEYRGIRDIPYDKTFLFHFSLFTGIVLLISIVFFTTLVGEIQDSTFELAFKLLPSDEKTILHFLDKQKFVLSSVIYSSIAVITGLYTALSWHLYSTVSGASYGFILTMKSFLKGSYNSRVHLIGFNYIRPHSRKLNKFLDYFCRELKIDFNK